MTTTRWLAGLVVVAGCGIGGGDDGDTDVDGETDAPVDTEGGDTDLRVDCPEGAPFCHALGALSWTDLSNDQGNGVTWEQADAACTALGGRLPTIVELRGALRGCPATEAGGDCLVSTTCTDVQQCGGSCGGCGEQTDGRYSAFGDRDVLWSDTSAVWTLPDISWTVVFSHGIVTTKSRSSPALYRCVR